MGLRSSRLVSHGASVLMRLLSRCHQRLMTRKHSASTSALCSSALDSCLPSKSLRDQAAQLGIRPHELVPEGCRGMLHHRQ
eukprot:5891931-Amphidinium_carterae.1